MDMVFSNSSIPFGNKVATVMKPQIESNTYITLVVLRHVFRRRCDVSVQVQQSVIALPSLIENSINYLSTWASSASSAPFLDHFFRYASLSPYESCPGTCHILPYIQDGKELFSASPRWLQARSCAVSVALRSDATSTCWILVQEHA